MGKVIAVTNQKGGVGKTTSCVNIACSLAHLNRRILMIDLDPQGNATMGSGVNKKQLSQSITHVLLGEAELQNTILATQAGYDLIPANADLTSAEIGLLQKQRREYQLLQALSRVKGSYDFILIDCPPSLNMLTVNALVAADSVLIPIQCEYYALEGLSSLVETVNSIRQSTNSKLEIEGLLRTMYDGRNRLTQDVSDQLNQHFGNKVFETVIPRNVRLAEAPSFGLPALLYDKASQGAQAYLELANEILRRREQEFQLNSNSAKVNE